MHTRHTDDTSTRLLSYAHDCEGEALEWIDTFSDHDQIDVLIELHNAVRSIRAEANAARLSRQLYIEGDECAGIRGQLDLSSCLRLGRRSLERWESKRMALVSELMEQATPQVA
jgi:hypothetical protein